MADGFGIPLSGLQSALFRQDVTANNIANVVTPGFQAQRADQVDLGGQGTRIAATTTLRNAGTFERTGNPVDLAVDGEGFFQVRTAEGGAAYARAGAFRIDSNRNLVTASGQVVQPEIQVPQDATAIQFSATGEVNAVLANGTVQQVGRLQLARFPNPGGLTRRGDSLLEANGASGAAEVGDPGQRAFGRIVSGALEGSNVDLAGELVGTRVNALLFRANLRVIRAQDDMLGEVLDIRG